MSESAEFSPARQYVKRRNYFVKKWLQSRYIIYYITIMFFSGLALFALIQHYAHRTLGLEMRQGHSAIFDTWSILKPQIFRANLIVFLTVAVVAAVTTLIITWTVHRAAGTLTSNIRAYIEGSPSEQWRAIRHPVEFQHLQDVLAGALSNHLDKVARIHREIGDCEAIIRGIREDAVEGTVIDRGIEEVRSRFERVKGHFLNLEKEGSHGN